MAGTFNTIVVTEIILKLLELIHSIDIYAKRYLTDKLLNYDLILGRDIHLELVGTWQEISISMKPSNCTTKVFFGIQENRSV